MAKCYRIAETRTPGAVRRAQKRQRYRRRNEEAGLLTTGNLPTQSRAETPLSVADQVRAEMGLFYARKRCKPTYTPPRLLG